MGFFIVYFYIPSILAEYIPNFLFMIRTPIILFMCIFMLSACSWWAPTTPTTQTISAEQPVSIVATTPLLLRGTEPFWSFSQSATGTATYSIPGLSSVEERYYTTTEMIVGSDIIITATPVNPADAPISVQVSSGTCSDGMSDIVYPYTVNLSYGLTPYSGCGQ